MEDFITGAILVVSAVVFTGVLIWGVRAGFYDYIISDIIAAL